MRSILIALLLFNTLMYSQENLKPTLDSTKLKNKDIIIQVQNIVENDSLINPVKPENSVNKTISSSILRDSIVNNNSADVDLTKVGDSSIKKKVDSDPYSTSKKVKDPNPKEEKYIETENEKSSDSEVKEVSVQKDRIEDSGISNDQNLLDDKDVKIEKESESASSISIFGFRVNTSKIYAFVKIVLFIFGILLTLLIVLFIVYRFYKKYNGLKMKISLLENENEYLKKDCKKLHAKIQNLNGKLGVSAKRDNGSNYKSQKEIESIKIKVIRDLIEQNNLNERELIKLKVNQENRWVTIGHSSIGKNHTNVTPITPCQDNNHFESLSDKFELAIVCDGAGSAKKSHFGSKFLSKGALPKNIKSNLKDLNWYKKGEIPTNLEWAKISMDILKQSYQDLEIWVSNENKKNNSNFSVNEFASTVIITIYNSKGVLVANIGDGRGGYLNAKGELKPLFIPFGGEESNGTIFITSPIWDKQEEFIQSNVFSEDILSVFLLSDGMEKSTFECSNLTDDVFIDPNIPYKNFFLPIFSKIKSISSMEEQKLSEEWKKFIATGTEAIKNEGDDKTLLISFLK